MNSPLVFLHLQPISKEKKRAVYQHSVFCPVSIKLLEKPGKKKKEGPQLLLMFAARAGYMYAAF